MKKAITTIASIDTYKTLSTFSSLEDLNQSIYSHITHHKNNLTKTMIIILKLLGRYSVKYLGVSYLTKNKIAEMVGKTRRTIIRVCAALEDLGIIKQHEMKRNSDQQQTSNAIVIQPFVEEADVETTYVTQDQPKNVTPKNNFSSLNNLKDLKTYNSPVLIPYEHFRDMCSCFTTEKKEINRLYGVYLYQIKDIKDYYSEKQLLDLGTVAIKLAYQATKRKKINNLFGYYKGVLDQLLTRLSVEEGREQYWSLESDSTMVENLRSRGYAL
ncbi:helix-turn-helix domain-containing protein [Metabacillus litoralis]|uniref:helix-turn-helix domain-containing protein n=1 Tax=Metabacillus litoralis TaxID=152268 RepID=UPI001CFCB9CF|nr:helix-turn-helix domain-containing protein [Metabacillus litoralis]